MWKAAPLVTPRNSVRQAWNNQADIKHAVDTGNQIFISPSKETGVPANYSREEMVWTPDSKTEMLATWVLGNVRCWSSSGHDYTYRSGIEGSKWYKIIREVIP